MRMGAPSEICNARAPRMRARSNRVYSSAPRGRDDGRSFTRSLPPATDSAAAVKGSATQGTVFTVCPGEGVGLRAGERLS